MFFELLKLATNALHVCWAFLTIYSRAQSNKLAKDEINVFEPSSLAKQKYAFSFLLCNQKVMFLRFLKLVNIFEVCKKEYFKLVKFVRNFFVEFWCFGSSSLQKIKHYTIFFTVFNFKNIKFMFSVSFLSLQNIYEIFSACKTFNPCLLMFSELQKHFFWKF